MIDASETMYSASVWGDATEHSFVRLDEPPLTSEPVSSVSARGQNFVIDYSRMAAGSSLNRSEQLDEYMVLLTSPTGRLTIDADGSQADVEGVSICIVPEGPSRITAKDDLFVYRVFTANTDDVVARSVNASAYEILNPDGAPLRSDAAPTNSLQVYRLDDAEIDPSKFGRAFRTNQLMVNFINPRQGPRDPSSLSPHVHDDFEQGSLVVAGEYVHHIRRPWTSAIADWRPDQHLRAGPNSIAVIPPGHVHTSQAVGEGTNLLIDIFAPPRVDLMSRPGFVLNEAVYG